MTKLLSRYAIILIYCTIIKRFKLKSKSWGIEKTQYAPFFKHTRACAHCVYICIKCKYVYNINNVYMYIYIHIHKWSYVICDTQSAQIWQKQDGHNIYMQSWKQCGLPIITIITLRQLIPLGTWCTVHLWPLIYTVHHVLKCLSCHKAIVVIRAHCFHDCIYIYKMLLGKFIYVCNMVAKVL